VTLIAALVPALRATGVAPIAALREGAELPRSRLARFGPWIAAVVGVVGVSVLVAGVFGSFSSTGIRLTIIGVGAVLLFLGVAMVSPALIRPLAAALGWPIERTTGVTGRLARDNASRNPGRTAVTAAALMIGLALVSFVTIFAAELRTSADAAVNREVAATYSIYNDQGAFIPHGVADAIARIPGVGATSTRSSDQARVDGSLTNVDGIQPASILSVYHFQWKHGTDAAVRGLGPRDALVSDTFASAHGLGLGSTLHVITTTNQHITFRVVGIYQTSRILASHILSDVALLFSVASPLSQGVAGAYVLLTLSILVSLVGIINTLVLSVYERTREIGMLRAIGTTRGQIRWIVRWESVITTVIGAVLGLVVGIVLAAIVTVGLASQGIVFTLPIGSLLIWLVVAAIFGIVAAAFPARRAARLEILQAIAYE
jgi:putative ABC transport system permease protein